MDSNALLGVLHALGLDVYAPIVLAVIGAFAALMTVVPVPAPGSVWVVPYRVASLLAGNWGKARNATPAPSVSTPPAAVLALLASGLALSACTAAQVQSGTETAVSKGQLFCALNTAAGPLVVALAEAGASALGAGRAISVIGRTGDEVARLCAVISAIPVVPPADPAKAPVVAVAVAK